jgi:hypothetical protein
MNYREVKERARKYCREMSIPDTEYNAVKLTIFAVDLVIQDRKARNGKN